MIVPCKSKMHTNGIELVVVVFGGWCAFVMTDGDQAGLDLTVAGARSSDETADDGAGLGES